MKYRLLFFLLAIMLQAPVMFADDDVAMASLTFNVDDAARIAISINGEEVTDLKTGPNVLDVMQWSNITIAPKEGCTLLSVVNSQNEAMSIGNDGSVTFMVYEATPETYTITSEKPSDVKFIIEIDNPEKVNVIDKDYKTITLTAGINNLEMSSLKFPILIGAKNYGDELYEVLYNDVEVESYYGSYSVTPEDNGIIKILADYPDKDCKVEFSYPDGVSKFFTAVTVNGDPVAKFNGEIDVKCGDKVALFYNPSCWDTEENPIIVEINGKAAEWFWSGYSFMVKEDTKVSIVQAVAVDMITVTVEADNPANIVVYRVDKDYNDIINLSKGVNTVELPEEDARLIITNVEKDGEESKITGITVNGTPKTVSYYNEFELKNLDPNDEVKIFTEGNFESDPDTGLGVNTIHSAQKIDGVYNLMGVKVAENAENLPAGIYVVNGKKIAVK